MPIQKLQKELKESEIRYRRLFETTQDGIVILDPKTRKITDANPYMSLLFGFSQTELVGKELYQIGLLKDAAASKKMFDEIKKKKVIKYENIPLRSKTTLFRDVEVTAHLYAENGNSVVQCTVHDVTERNRTVRELFESKQRLEALMNALPIGVAFSQDVSCEFITGNPSLLRQLEMKPGDNISASSPDNASAGRKLQHYIDGRSITARDMPMQRAIIEDREIGPIEIEVKLPSGKRWFHEAVGAPIRDAHGKVIASVAVHVDLTERKRAEEANRLERVIEQEKIKLEFIADAAHELRTPLAIIKGNIDLAQRSGFKETDMAETFKAIDNEVMHLANLLSDLTLLTTNGSDFQRKISAQKINISQLVSKIAGSHARFAEKKLITINMQDLPDTFVSGDQKYLDKLFSNIIANAVSYGKEHGSVAITGSTTAKDIRIHIADNGIGISKKDLPHIFDRFYRADSSRSKDTGGTGLGLAIVKWIAEAHGGTVSATSIPGKGSTFTVTLPLYIGKV